MRAPMATTAFPRQQPAAADALMGDRTPKYNRILLKLSGEALGGKRDYGIDSSPVIGF